MRPDQRPPTVGIGAAIAYVVIALAPYVVLDVEPGVLDFYYTTGLAGPHLLSVFALVAVVLFAAGRQGRTEPDIVAGLTLVLGVVLFVVTVQWALSVPETIIVETTDASWFPYHRWLAVLTAAIIPVAAGWYTRVLGLF